MPASKSLTVMLLFLGAASCQIVGVWLLPMTKGMTSPTITIAAAIFYAFAIFCMSRLLVAGVTIGFLIPLLTLLVVGGSMCVGIFAYGEKMSAIKLGLLAVATLMITVATRY